MTTCACLLASGPPLRAETTALTPIAPLTVVAVTPLPGTPIDADKLPGEIDSLSISQLAIDRRTDSIANLVESRLASVSVNDEQGSPFQPDFTFRGFTASPISGVAEGLAVYQDGVRLNESFGDNVNWDLVPRFAVRAFTVQSNNPAFGLNALGGAVTMEMKDGLAWRGVDADLSGGSFGDLAGHVEVGRRLGNWGLYVAVGGQRDDGFRDHSPATLRQAYGDLGYERGAVTLHLSVSAARNDIDAVGPTPVELLAHDRKAAFTYPQSTHDQAELIQLRGGWRAGDRIGFTASAYYRRFEQRLVDGNTTDVAVCANDPSHLCLGGDGLFPGDALHDAHGAVVPAAVLPAGATPGETDVTHTRTDSVGGTVQAAVTAPIAGRANTLVMGVSIDHGLTRYAAHGELGALGADLSVAGVGVIIDQALSPTAAPPIEAPVDVTARNTYVGVYAIDVVDLTPNLSLTLSGRWNAAGVSLTDRTGGDLNADHGFTRFDPGVGLAWRMTSALTAYVGYSESNRAPTAGELACADPASPCLLDAFLVSDPPLKQVVSRNVEAGLRGRFTVPAAPGAAFTWKVAAYHTRSGNDILLVATDINGFGYFRNAGDTLRQGVDATLAYHAGPLDLHAGYTFLDATFRDAETLSSNSPAADGDGLIHVRKGDHLPLSPAHRLTISADYDVSGAWSLGADLRWQSGQFLVGDASNQEPKLPGYATVTLRAAYRLGPRVELFGEIENLLDQRFYTYGAFSALKGLPPNFHLTDPRTYSPAAGRAFTVGARVKLG